LTYFLNILLQLVIDKSALDSMFQRPLRQAMHLFSSAALAVFFATASAARADTLSQVVDQVLKTHPRLKAALSTARSVKYEIEQAQAGNNPKFGLIADPGRAYNRATRDWGAAGDFGMRGTYLLYDGNRTDNEIDRQRSRFQSASERSKVTEDQLAAQVSDAYIEVLKQRRLEQLAASNVDAHTDLYEKTQEIVKLDKGRAYDLTQAGARLQQAKVTLSSRRGLLEEARLFLNDLAGFQPRDLVMPVDPVKAIPPTQRAALDQLDLHPALKAAQAEIETARRASDIAAAWYKPRVDLQGTVNSPQDFQGDRDYLKGYDVRFAMQWNPFDGGAGRAASQAAAEQLNAAKDNTDSVRRDLSNEVTRFWSQIETRRSRMGAWDDLVKQNARVRDAYWQQFKIGKRSMLDLLNAENELFQTKSSAETDRMELLQSQYRLLGGLAQLTQWLGVSRSVATSPSEPRAAPKPAARQ
jgi:TolC family type I secretion outer membrane protein